MVSNALEYAPPRPDHAADLDAASPVQSSSGAKHATIFAVNPAETSAAVSAPGAETGRARFLVWLAGNQHMGHASRVTRRMVEMLRS